MQKSSPRGGTASSAAEELFRAPDLVRLRRRRARISGPLSAVTFALYVGFFVVVALAPHALGHRVNFFGSIGVLLMVAMFVAAWALVWLYLGVFSPALERERDAILAAHLAEPAERREP